MSGVPTWQDMELAVQEGNKLAFILSAIDLYKQSDIFIRAGEATEYYGRKNTAILERMSFLERKLGGRLPIIFYRIISGFYPKFINRWVFFTLGNGLSLEKEKKKKLGKRFDKRFMIHGVVPACHAGVCYAFWDKDHVEYFPAYDNDGYNGFFPLLDRRTSDIKACIRFRQIDADNPMYVDLFEIDGITEFEASEDGTELTVYRPKRAYKSGNYIDNTTTIPYNEIDESVRRYYKVPDDLREYSELPVYPIYVNALKASEFNDGFKSQIDAFDAILSDLVDQIVNSEGMYSAVKNAGGDNFIDTFEMLQGKIFPIDENAGTDVAMHVMEAPFQAKMAALEILENRMYSDFLLPNPNRVHRDGRQVTAREIAESGEELNNKADILEWLACDTVEKILTLIGVEFDSDDLEFKRRTVINDSERIKDISIMKSDGYIDDEECLELNPIVAVKRKPIILARLALAEQEQAEDDFALDDGQDGVTE